ncbi:hypothetical protein [Anaerovorax sp. IOR16]|nr:hypothetical protein [Anaerovorax sp. IOR16]
MFKFINNDTIALVFLGTVALVGVGFKSNEIVATAIGAIGGYIGGKSESK